MVQDEIRSAHNEILNAIIEKKRSIRRKWKEVQALTNAHMLIHLPYQAQLSHVSKLVEERRPIIEEIQQHSAAGETGISSDNKPMDS